MTDILKFLNDPVYDDMVDHSHDIVLTVPNAYCNLKCKYCYFDNCKASEPPVLLKEKVIEKFKLFSKYTGRITIWAGEPLYNKEIFGELCELVNLYLPNYKINIYTNGTLLNDWWADFIISHNVHINLSHDGPGQKYRGVDYFKLDTQKKAIKKISENGHLISVTTVIHKYNCSFFDIVNYFNNAEKELGIQFERRTQNLVGANLENDLPLDFDYMDKDLIKYIQDLMGFLFKELITGDKNGYVKKWFYWSTVKSYFPIFQNLLGIDPKIRRRCDKTSSSTLHISSLGDYICIYQAYAGAFLPEVCKVQGDVDFLEKCSNCEISISCPIKDCQKLSIDDNFCKKVIARYRTIEYAMVKLLEQFGIKPESLNYKGEVSK